MLKYLIVIERSKTGYGAYVPDLPGCVATAKTKKSLERNIYEAIQFHLEGLREEGLPIPKPTTESEMVLLKA